MACYGADENVQMWCCIFLRMWEADYLRMRFLAKIMARTTTSISASVVRAQPVTSTEHFSLGFRNRRTHFRVPLTVIDLRERMVRRWRLSKRVSGIFWQAVFC
jgi:hypothetical protein